MNLFLFLETILMIAAIDIGNTQIKVGLFKADTLHDVAMLNVESLFEYLSTKHVTKVVISSVSKERRLITTLKKIYPDLLLLNSNTPLPIKIDYLTPKTLGIDRIAAAVGATSYFSGPLVVIDAGSCITCDLINDEGTFLGGTISPGLQMRLQAMHNFTANLPLVKLEVPKNFIGKSTQEGMLSGTINGAKQEVFGFIQQYYHQFPDLKVIICGGDRFFFDKLNELETFVLPNLVLEGLYAILKFNDKV